MQELYYSTAHPKPHWDLASLLFSRTDLVCQWEGGWVVKLTTLLLLLPRLSMHGAYSPPPKCQNGMIITHTTTSSYLLHGIFTFQYQHVTFHCMSCSEFWPVFCQMMYANGAKEKRKKYSKYYDRIHEEKH
jgi:predicted small integral membrane protein